MIFFFEQKIDLVDQKKQNIMNGQINYSKGRHSKFQKAWKYLDWRVNRTIYNQVYES